MADEAGSSGSDELGLREAGCVCRFGRVEDVIEGASGFGGGVEAGVAAELETEVFLVDPDVAAILAGEVGPLVEVEGETAVIAGGFGMRL
jgi:hypothetical protein